MNTLVMIALCVLLVVAGGTIVFLAVLLRRLTAPSPATRATGAGLVTAVIRPSTV
jgi:hypothetical protein